MAEIIFNGEDPQEIPDGSPIKPICEENGIPFACEEGICGTCIIEVEEGLENLTPFTQEEVDFLGPQEDRIKRNQPLERLACQCKLMSGCVKVRY